MSHHAQDRPSGRAGHSLDNGNEPGRGSFWKSTGGLVTIAFLAIGAFFLISEHRAHVLGWLPFLLLLACPLLHHLMHGGHRGHTHHSGPVQRKSERDDVRPRPF